jgi:hypothetical protein
VFRHIVNIGGRREKLGVVIEIHENDKRVGFGRAMGGDTRQEFSVHPECWIPVRCARLHVRQSEPDTPHGFEVDYSSGYSSARLLGTRRSFRA